LRLLHEPEAARSAAALPLSRWIGVGGWVGDRCSVVNAALVMEKAKRLPSLLRRKMHTVNANLVGLGSL